MPYIFTNKLFLIGSMIQTISSIPKPKYNTIYHIRNHYCYFHYKKNLRIIGTTPLSNWKVFFDNLIYLYTIIVFWVSLLGLIRRIFRFVTNLLSAIYFDKYSHSDQEKIQKKDKTYDLYLLICRESISFVFLFIWLSSTNLRKFQPLEKGCFPEYASYLKSSSYSLNEMFGVGLECINENDPIGRSYIQRDITIFSCFFSRNLVYSGDGGIIYVSGGIYNLTVSLSMFFRCECSGYGGAVYFNSYNLYFNMVCANRCSCGDQYNGHFAFLRTSMVNQLDYQSISYCSENLKGHYSIYLYNGDHQLNYMNSSLNIAQLTSGIGTWYSSTFRCFFCTISNNQESDSICIEFQGSNGVMSYSNIVHNNSPSRYGVVHVSSQSKQKMQYCIFYYNHNVLFDVYSISLEVSHCCISHYDTFSSRVPVSLSNITLTIKETYKLEFFQSHYCHADFPLSSPIFSLKQTQKDTILPTAEKTTVENPIPTPYRSFDENPIPTPNRSFDESLYYQSQNNIPTPYASLTPIRTDNEVFDPNYYERTQMKTVILYSKNFVQGEANSEFIYSTIVLSMIILMIGSYYCGYQKNNHHSSSSSFSEMKSTTNKNELYPNIKTSYAQNPYSY